MNLLEFIGFIVSMLALFVLMVKKVLEERRRRANPEEYEREEQEQAERLRAFLNSVRDDMQSPSTSSQQRGGVPRGPSSATLQRRPKPPSQDNYSLAKGMTGTPHHSSSENLKLKNNHQTPGVPLRHRGINRSLAPLAAHDAYQLKPERSFRPSRALKTISHLKSRRDLIIIHEILDAPKGLRTTEREI